MDIAKLTSQRSNCIRRKVGAVCVKDNRILSLGYNGTPRDTLNCFEGGCPRCNNPDVSSGMSLETCLCLHAEENALLFVKKEDLEESTLQITLLPCVGCVKKILQCKIKRIVYEEVYNHSDTSLGLLQKQGVVVDRVSFKL